MLSRADDLIWDSGISVLLYVMADGSLCRSPDTCLGPVGGASGGHCGQAVLRHASDA